MLIQRRPKILHKEPVQRLDWLRGIFENEDCFIVAGGPSLHGFDFDRLNGKRVIAVNHSYLYTKPDILCALDGTFFGEARQRGHNFNDFDFMTIAGPSACVPRSDKVYLVHCSQEPTTNTPHSLFGSASSTLLAINAALYTKAKRIFLLGLDGKFVKGLGHFYSDKWKHRADSAEIKYKRVIHHYNKFAKFKNIFNCNRDSEIKVFPHYNLDLALCGQKVSA